MKGMEETPVYFTHLVLITHLEKIQLPFLQVLLPLWLLIKCFLCHAKYGLELSVGQIRLGIRK